MIPDRELRLEMELDAAHRAAVHMARALRDIFNNGGHMLEVRADFTPVERFVQDYEDQDPDKANPDWINFADDGDGEE